LLLFARRRKAFEKTTKRDCKASLCNPNLSSLIEESDIASSNVIIGVGGIEELQPIL